MSREPADPLFGPPLGTTLLYEEFKRQVLGQLADAEAVDRKIGVAIAALVATAGALYAARPPVLIGGVLAGWLLAGLIQAVRGFSYEDRFTDGPDSEFFREREALEPDIIKWHALVAFEAALELNEPKLRTKGMRLTQVVVTLGLVAAVALLGKAVNLS